MSEELLEDSVSPAPATDLSNNHVRTWADVCCMLGRSDNNHEAMQRWRQRKAEKRRKRRQKLHSDCGDASLGSERTDVQHGCFHFSVSDSVSASRITSFGQRLHASSIHSPLTDRGTLSEDAAFIMSLRLQLIDDSGVSDANANSVAPTMGVTEIACCNTMRRVWSLESCGNQHDTNSFHH